MKEENGMTATPVEPIVSPFYDRDGITIYNADCRDVLPMLGKFDLLLTDPPYGLGDKLGPRERTDQNKWAKHFNAGAPEWDKTTPTGTLMAEVIAIGERAIVWGGQFYELPVGRCWLAWNKIIRNWSSSEHELAWTNLDKPNRAFDYSHGQLATEGKHWHPTQKPLPLMKWCIGFVPEAKSVLDPFMGSGTTLVAAKLLGLRAVGIEINRNYCEAAVERLRQGVLDFGSEG